MQKSVTYGPEPCHAWPQTAPVTNNAHVWFVHISRCVLCHVAYTQRQPRDSAVCIVYCRMHACTCTVHMLQLHSLCGGIEYMLALAHFFEEEAALLGFYPESYSWRLDYYQHLWIMASKSRKQIFRPEYTTKWPCPVTFWCVIRQLQAGDRWGERIFKKYGFFLLLKVGISAPSLS